MRWGLRFGVVAAGIAGGLLACQVLVGIEDDPGVDRFPPRPPDASTDAAPDVDPCPHAGPPGEPDSGASTPESKVVLAVRKVRLGGFPDLPQAFDFDKTCSCENRDQRLPGSPQTSCKQEGDPCAPGSPTDDPEGRDLGAVNAFRGASLVLPQLEQETVNPYFELGRAGALLRIEGYNETPNDRRVVVTVLPSRGIQEPANGGPIRTVDTACQAAEAAANGLPRWSSKLDAGPDATLDRWYTAGSGEATGSVGYVTDGQVIVNGAKTAYEIPFGGFSLRQTNSIFVSRLQRGANGRWTLRGNIVGLVSVAKLLEVLGRLPSNGGFLCGTLQGKAIADFICRAQDLLESSDDPAKACDAIALAIGVEAEEAAIGDPALCPPADAGIDPTCALRCDK
jgi:hypothetical protein